MAKKQVWIKLDENIIWNMDEYSYFYISNSIGHIMITVGEAEMWCIYGVPNGCSLKDSKQLTNCHKKDDILKIMNVIYAKVNGQKLKIKET